MSSFTAQLPRHILHKVIEPQWLPHRKEETESTLTALEAAEEAHTERLNKIVQNTTNIFIGGQRQTSGRRRQTRPTSEEASTTTIEQSDDASTVVAQQPPHLPHGRFWNRRRSTTSTMPSGGS